MIKLFRMAMVFIVTIMVSCSSDDSKPTDDMPNTENGSLLKGTKKQLELINPSNESIVWTSDDPAIATVDSDGLVSGVAEGTVNITAKIEENIIQQWVITVTEQISEGSEFIITWNATEITIPTNPEFDPNKPNYNYNVDWDNDGTPDETGITGDVTHTFDTPGEHTIRISGVFPSIYCFKLSTEEKAKLISVDQWGTGEWITMTRAFYECSNLEVLATDTPNLREGAEMDLMFSKATKANPDVSNWDVSNVTNMRHMFSAATSANPDVSKWNVSNVTNMDNIFREASSANPDVSDWDVSNVVNMRYMFFQATSANPDVSQWNIANVTNMHNMFVGATSFSKASYENLLINFAGQSHQSDVILEVGDVIATSAEALAARKVLTDDGWTIYDGS